MPKLPTRRVPAAGLIVCLIGLATLAGCQEDQITHSIVPRAAEPERTRLLGAIYPHGDQTWYFKLMGPESAFEGMDKPFDDFLQSVRFTDKADAPVTWTLPEGWKQEEARPPLYAAVRVEHKALKLNVAALPRKKDKDAEVLDNVNRWRGQLGLEPVAAGELAKTTRDDKINGDTVVRVDLTGARPGSKSAQGPAWTYRKPDGWDEVRPEVGQIKSEAAFQVKDGDQTAKTTVTALGGPAGGLGPNVDRWARQIEAEPIPPEKLDKLPTMTVSGREAPYVDLTGKTGRTLGVIVGVGDKTWFFKLTGSAGLVEKQKPKFEEFIKSVKFEGGEQ